MHTGISMKKKTVKAAELEALFADLRKELKSKGLAGQAPVFSSGPCDSPIMVIGEAPGREETREGRPFVGRAGRFFSEILEAALTLERDEIYITNAVKFWPVVETKRLKTRKPTAAEEALFHPCLMEEIRIVAPRVIIAVGKTAFSALLPDKEFIPGRWAELKGVAVMPVYHPAYMLRRLKSLDESRAALKEALLSARESAFGR